MTQSNPPIRRYWKTANPDSLNSLWFDVLGWVAYYFAQLEGASYLIIESLEQTPAVRDVCCDLGYEKRSKVAAGLIAAKVAGDATLTADWQAFWTKAIDAAPMRNKVLHNPLTKDLLAQEEMEEHDGVQVRKGKKSVLTLGAVQAYNDQLVALNRELRDLLQRSKLV